MQPFRWEIEGQVTHPLERAGNTYQLKLEESIIQVYENGYKILEEDISDQSLQAHRNQDKPLSEQLLEWGGLVLETFVKQCESCGNERMSFPIDLTKLPPEELAMCKSQKIEIICPMCVDSLTKKNRERSIRLKQAFLRGEVKIFGGTSQELFELMQSPTGQFIQQFSSVIFPGWKLGAISFSDNRLYLSLIHLNNDQIESFVILVENQPGQLTTLLPDVGLEALGFQESDDIQFLSFQ
ncbi:MAG TPA: hypothetical protein VJ824_15740 [Bacillota bacterium]|nr:hypothetical protein [Bacillota bacterium]